MELLTCPPGCRSKVREVGVREGGAPVCPHLQVQTRGDHGMFEHPTNKLLFFLVEAAASLGWDTEGLGPRDPGAR